MSNANSPTAESVYDDSDELESVAAAEVAALLLPPRPTSTNSPSVVNTPAGDVAMSSGDAGSMEMDDQQLGALDSTKRPIPSSTEIIMNESATANSDPQTPSSVRSTSATPFPAPTNTSKATESTTEFFKVPLPPPAAAQSLHGLPADIEHIIAMGLDAPDESEPVPTSNYEKVVKDLREKSGFAASTSGEMVGVPVGDGLASIEQEMLVGGVPRQAANVEMTNGEVATGEAWTATRDAAMEESADSSDASSESSESEAEVESIPLDIPASPSTAPKSKKAQAKVNRKKKAASDDDLSDDDVNTSSTAPKTEHEVALPIVEAPKITMIPESEEIIKFGTIASIIDTVVVVKADTAGDWRVLDEGSLCCWGDRGVIGNIFETFGSVQSPFYSVRFPSNSTLDPVVYSIGRAVFYAPKMSSFVFTRDIRALKGSDASNVWDEEVGAAEMEYSDDEAEQAQKRNAKNDRKSRSASLAPSDASRQGSRAPSVGPATSKSNSHPTSLPPRPPASARQPYDSDPYVPLERPRDLHLMGNAPPPPREGRQMFERDNGGRLGGGEMGVEYDFSDDDETGSISSTFEVDERYREIDEMARVERENAASRGGARGGRRGAMRGGNDDRGGRGRGGFEGRGRGRGNSDDRGRGRGRGRGDSSMRGGGSDRGRGGERNGPSNGPPRHDESPRQVAPLPQRYSGPPAPGFNGPPPPPSAGYSPSRPGPNAPHPNSNPSQSPRPMQYPHYPQQLQPSHSPHQPHSPTFPAPPPHAQPPPFTFNPMAAMGGFNSYPQQRQPLYQNQSRSFNTAGMPIPSGPSAQQSTPAPQYPPPNQFGFQPNQYMPFAPQMMGFPGFMGQQYSPGGAGGAPGQFQQQQNIWRNQNASQNPAGQGGAKGAGQEGRSTGNPNAYWPAGQNGETRE